ncbi:MAG TPA: KEOPS complex subunit Pcc1 [Candidatus Bilamarchaeaceae archaeon]|nr:KEOPS complex subunit Pcc1 [Candidatus Bilamarchaeaceae archaeon]
MGHKAVLSLEFDDLKSLDSALLALNNEKDLGRTKSLLSKNGSKLMIEINSNDATALRAALNSYLRYIQVIENMRCIDG